MTMYRQVGFWWWPPQWLVEWRERKRLREEGGPADPEMVRQAMGSPLLASQGYLTPEQNRRFIDALRARSTLLPAPPRMYLEAEEHRWFRRLPYRVRWWLYWNATDEATERVTDYDAVRRVLDLTEPAWRDVQARIVMRSLDRPEGWFDLPGRAPLLVRTIRFADPIQVQRGGTFA